MRGSSLVFNRRMVQRFRQLSISVVGSAKIKLLLCCFFVFTVIVLSSRLPDFMGWTHQIASLDRFSVHRKGYTLLINTWKRNDLLKQSISHYTSCAGLGSIHIVWSEPDPPSKALSKFLNHVMRSKSRDGRKIELKFDINKEDTLNNRFKEIKDLKTDAVFSVDDDIIFPCSSVDFGFTVWRSAADTMVGFVPRIHWNCEDIAMSFLVANATGAPPIWVKGEINEIGSTGISSLGGHNEKRSQCVNRFASEYSRMPLVSTSVKAVDGHNTWFW